MRIGIQTWGSEGDVRPLLALADALVARGHMVDLRVTPLGLVQLPTRPGGPQITCVGGASAQALKDLAHRVGPNASEHTLLKALFQDLLKPQLPVMEAAAAELVAKSEIVIGHFVVHPLAAAARAAGKPHVSVMFFPGLIPTVHAAPQPFPNLGRWLNPLAWRLVGRLLDRIMLAECQATFARTHQQVRQVVRDAWTSPQLNLLAASPVLWPRAADWPAYHVVTGEFIPPTPPQALPQALADFLADGEPPVYLGLGSPQQVEPAAITQLLVDAARATGRRAIVRTMTDTWPEWTRDGNIFFAGAVDHRALFPRCAAVVHHGGAGTSHSALRAGVPAVAITFINEQKTWGKRLHQAGVAAQPLALRRATPARIADLITQALDPVRVAAAKTLATRMASEDGLAVACARIEALARIPEG